MKLPKLILASGSPRRAEILTSVGWEFTKQTADIDETEIAGEDPAGYVRRLALEKAETVARQNKNSLVLGADTTVVIDGEIIGKPSDLADARRMLGMLSGRWHEVLTGVAVVRDELRIDEKKNPQSAIPNPKSAVCMQRTRVKFAGLSRAEIDFLAEQGEPLDKAGAYGVQAQAALFIEEIRGDYCNVVGLPINLVYSLVRDFG